MESHIHEMVEITMMHQVTQSARMLIKLFEKQVTQRQKLTILFN